MPSPTEIANMYSQDLSGIDSANRFYAQLAAQRSAQNAQNKLQREKVEADSISDIATYAPTNTMYDEKGAAIQQSILNKYVDLGKANPNMTIAEKKQAIYPDIAKLSQWSQKAKLADAQIKSLTDMADKEMKWADKNKLKNDVYRGVFYKDGELLDEPNLGYLQEVDLDNPEYAESVANFDSLPLLAQKEMSSLYAPQVQKIMGDGKTTPNYDVSMYDFEDFDPNTKSVSLRADKVKVGDKQIDVLKEDAIRYIPNNTNTKLLLRGIKRELGENEDFNQLPEETQARAAMAEYLNRFGKSKKSGNIAIDRKDMDSYRQMQQQDIANANAQRRLRIAEEANLRDREKHIEAIKNKPNTPDGIHSLIVSGTMRDGKDNPIIPESQVVLSKKYSIPIDNSVFKAVMPSLSNETKKAIKDEAGGGGKTVPISKLKGLVKMIDLSAANGGYFTDAFTQKPYKLISTIDNNSNGVVLTKVFYTPSGGVGSPLIVDEKTTPIVLKDEKIGNELMLIGDQLRRGSKAELEEVNRNKELILGQ